MSELPKLALIGAGRMGGALLTGWLASGMAASDILIVDPNVNAVVKDAASKGARYAQTLSPKLAADLDMLVLAVKPQMFEDAAPKLAAALPPQTAVLSVMAGTTQSQLANAFGERPLLRAMPNTPCAIGQGITGYYPNRLTSELICDKAEILLRAGGDVIRVNEESLIDVVTGVSGSGPAYVFYMVEALAAAAQRRGMPEALAHKLARQTIIGSGALLAASEESAADLRRAVTSPNGTTQAGLEVLMGEGGLAHLMRETVKAATARSKELGKS